MESELDHDTMRRIEDMGFEMSDEAMAEVADQGVPYDGIATVTRVHLRYDGTDNALPVMLDEAEIMRRDFEAQHRQRYGFVSPEKKVFVAALEVEATGGGAQVTAAGEVAAVESRELPATDQRVRFFSNRNWHDGPVYTRDQLFTGATVEGPALIIEPHQTVVVEPGWRMDVTGEDNLVLTRVTPRQREILGEAADPVLLEVFNNLFMSIAEQMGEALRNTAQSVNIKERLDFSCAVFDSTASLSPTRPICRFTWALWTSPSRLLPECAKAR